MIDFSELEKGIRIILDGQPYEVIETHHLKKGRGQAVVRSKLRNLITGGVLERTFHPGEEFEEAEISQIKAIFLYSHREKYVFLKKDDKKRFELKKEQLGEKINFLKPNLEVEGLVFKDKIINISLPIKVQLKVIEAPPGVKGDRAQGGTKIVTLETGGKIQVPLFVEEGDIIEVNTQKGEYVKRVQK